MKNDAIYRSILWPEIQDYIEDENYDDNIVYSPSRDVWFVPEDIYLKYKKT